MGTVAVDPLSYDLGGYDSLVLPDLPPRFQHLKLPTGWFVPGKNSRRKHAKSHGLIKLAELARTVGANWKSADKETKEYCIMVANLIRDKHAEQVKKHRAGFVPYSMVAVSQPRPCPLQSVQHPAIVEDHNFANHCTMMSKVYNRSPFLPFADETGINRNMMHQYQHSQPEKVSSTASMLAGKGLDADRLATKNEERDAIIEAMQVRYNLQAVLVSHLNQQNHQALMPTPTTPGAILLSTSPSLAIPPLPLTDCAPNSIGSAQPEAEFSVITNVNRRAMISNIMTLSGIAMSCRKYAEESSPSIKLQSKLECLTYSQPGDECMGMLCLPTMTSVSQVHRSPSEHDRKKALYNIEELAVADAHIHGIWLSSTDQEETDVAPPDFL